MTQFRINPDERAISVGRTGCGKTTLNKYLLSQCDNIVVFDTKGEFELPDAIKVFDPADLGRVRPEGRPIIYQPLPEFWEPEIHNGFFLWIFNRKNTTLYVDEIYSAMNGVTAPRYFQACLTQGRSKKIRTLGSTQRPFNIPLSILSESEHRFCFDLNLKQDRLRMAELMTDNVLLPLKNEHGFRYYNVKSKNLPTGEYILKMTRRG